MNFGGDGAWDDTGRFGGSGVAGRSVCGSFSVDDLADAAGTGVFTRSAGWILLGSWGLNSCSRVGCGTFKLAFEAFDLSDSMDFDIGEFERVLAFEDASSGSAGSGLIGALAGGWRIILEMSDFELMRRVL